MRRDVRKELELIQSDMAQKPVLRGEVGCACVAREVSVERGGMGERGCARRLGGCFEKFEEKFDDGAETTTWIKCKCVLCDKVLHCGALRYLYAALRCIAVPVRCIAVSYGSWSVRRSVRRTVPV